PEVPRAARTSTRAHHELRLPHDRSLKGECRPVNEKLDPRNLCLCGCSSTPVDPCVLTTPRWQNARPGTVLIGVRLVTDVGTLMGPIHCAILAARGMALAKYIARLTSIGMVTRQAEVSHHGIPVNPSHTGNGFSRRLRDDAGGSLGPGSAWPRSGAIKPS